MPTATANMAEAADNSQRLNDRGFDVVAARGKCRMVCPQDESHDTADRVVKDQDSRPAKPKWDRRERVNIDF